jgi:two-component system CheB/CheR fusion protein
VVGIGASAGGLPALRVFFEALPSDLGLAYVVILHLAPDRPSELAKVLSRHTQMPVSPVEAATPLKPDHVYVIPPDQTLEITDHEVSPRPFREPRGQRAPVDLFLRSLANHLGDPFAIILSGAGSDGALGVRAIKEAGGIVLAQDPGEAEHASMPRNAIATGAVDIVAPAEELAIRLAELARGGRPASLGDSDEEILQRILGQLRGRTGHDFSNYKRSTLQRRILRRMHVTRMESLTHYLAYLRENAEEANALFAELLISVTVFFRDPKAFDILAQEAIPRLFADRERDEPVRVWVPGCATGEEAYSLAMLLLEAAAKMDVRPEIQVFATDLDSGALAVARQGLYPGAIEADVGEDRLRRFFTSEGEHFRVKRDRDMVLFANHSLLRDPPFSHLDLISCRNLMIYLERELQHEVLATFHYALKPRGLLFLGSSETAEHPAGLFRVANRDAHLYQSVRARGSEQLGLPRLSNLGMGAPVNVGRASPSGFAPAPSADMADHRHALERAAPPSILVDQHHRAVHLSETAGRFLQPSGGPLTADVVDLVRPELRLDLRAALDRALNLGESTLTLPVLMDMNGDGVRRVCLQVQAAPRAPTTGRGRRWSCSWRASGSSVRRAPPPRSRSTSGRPTRRCAGSCRSCG